MKKVRLIAFDLDGTVLMNDHIHEAPGILKALETAYNRGIYVIPVTGRPYGLLPPMFDEKRDWWSFGIFCNGGEIRNLQTGDAFFSLALSRETLELIASQSQKYGIPAEFCTADRIYLTRQSWEKQKEDPKLSFHVNTILKNHGTKVESLMDVPTENVQKAHLNGVPKDLQKILNKEYEKLGLLCDWSSDGYGEITSPDGSKGKTLEKLCSRLSVSMEEVMALGDSDNDISMLRAAGLGIAMGNAPEHIKKEAAFVTRTNEEDGAASAVFSYL